MLEDLSLNQKEILFQLIKFYTFPQDDYLKLKYGEDDFNVAKKKFNEKIEYFLNKKIGIDRVYNSLFNIGSSYLSFRYMIGNYPNALQNNDNEKKAFISFNEPFVNSVILNFNIFYELIKFNMKDISMSPELKACFGYINDLCNRIQKSGIISIRDRWVAHPFKDKNIGVVFSPQEIHTEVFKAFSILCIDEDKAEFKKNANDRLAWFCQKYIVQCIEHYPSIPEAIHGVLTRTPPPVHQISTKPSEILIEMNKFSSLLRDKKLFGIEPFFHPSEEDIEYVKVNGLSNELNI
ncbi:hypothetical protein [Pectobacterium polaris]|uniref:hypothetical protein n=1 Tax=Pectobacterium polaris TaxID=2042057 RepID=UPI001968E754|nr:hypothetical protein [Pectobacterium polaris]MBN3217125.1 hypothetical protein [Pectobacterium polaris]